MLTRFQFWLVTVVVALGTLIGFVATGIPLVLWIGGLALFFWVNGRIREEIEDNYYINAAYTTLTACVLTVPQIFYARTAGGWALLAVTVGYQALANFTNLDYTSHRSREAVARNWSSKTKTRGQKARDHYTITQANWAGIILTGIAFLAGEMGVFFLAVRFSYFFLLLVPVYTFLWHLIFLVYMWFVGVPPPVGRCYPEPNNFLRGFGFLFGVVLKAILSVILAPFRFIAFVCRKIGEFFGNVVGGGSAEISKFYWVCVIALGVYLILSIFGIADFIEEIFGGFDGIGLDINLFLMPICKFLLGLELPSSFFNDVILFLPKILVLVVGFVLDLVLLILVCLLWLVLNLVLFILYVLLVVAFEAVLPIGLGLGAIVFLVLYLIHSERGFFDWLRAILLALLPIGLFILYVLFFNGNIKLF